MSTITAPREYILKADTPEAETQDQGADQPEAVDVNVNVNVNQPEPVAVKAAEEPQAEATGDTTESAAESEPVTIKDLQAEEQRLDAAYVSEVKAAGEGDDFNPSLGAIAAKTKEKLGTLRQQIKDALSLRDGLTVTGAATAAKSDTSAEGNPAMAPTDKEASKRYGLTDTGRDIALKSYEDVDDQFASLYDERQGNGWIDWNLASLIRPAVALKASIGSGDVAMDIPGSNFPPLFEDWILNIVDYEESTSPKVNVSRGGLGAVVTATTESGTITKATTTWTDSIATMATHHVEQELSSLISLLDPRSRTDFIEGLRRLARTSLVNYVLSTMATALPAANTTDRDGATVSNVDAIVAAIFKVRKASTSPTFVVMSPEAGSRIAKDAAGSSNTPGVNVPTDGSALMTIQGVPIIYSDYTGDATAFVGDWRMLKLWGGRRLRMKTIDTAGDDDVTQRLTFFAYAYPKQLGAFEEVTGLVEDLTTAYS